MLCRQARRSASVSMALYGSLDEEHGGEITRNLSQLYMFCLRRLPRVDLKNDATPAQEALEILEPLAKSWRELAAREQYGPLVDGEVPSRAADQTAAPHGPGGTSDTDAAARESVNLMG